MAPEWVVLVGLFGVISGVVFGVQLIVVAIYRVISSLVSLRRLSRPARIEGPRGVAL